MTYIVSASAQKTKFGRTIIELSTQRGERQAFRYLRVKRDLGACYQTRFELLLELLGSAALSTSISIMQEPLPKKSSHQMLTQTLSTRLRDKDE